LATIREIRGTGGSNNKKRETIMDTITRIRCCRCSKMNLVELGDTEDLTIPDVEAFRCWNCKEISWSYEGQEDQKILTNPDPKNANINDIDCYDENDCDVFVVDGKEHI